MTKRNEVIQIRVSPEEKTQIEAQAEKAGNSVSEWIRHTALLISDPVIKNFLKPSFEKEAPAEPDAKPTRQDAERLAQQIHFVENIPVHKARDKAYKQLGLKP